VLKSAAAGIALATLAGVLAFTLLSQFRLAALYLAPGVFLAGWLSPWLPTRMAYWGNPEGGPANFLFLVAVCAGLVWSALCTGVHYMLARRRRMPSSPF